MLLCILTKHGFPKIIKDRHEYFMSMIAAKAEKPMLKEKCYFIEEKIMRIRKFEISHNYTSTGVCVGGAEEYSIP